MLGYPGSGKTTTAKFIHELTGAVHLWADNERHNMFEHVTHSHDENVALYKVLNERVDEMLGEGKSIVFDTNFNFYKDRQRMREIAAKHGAKLVLVWVKVPKELARQRATQNVRPPYNDIFPEDRFERMSSNLQEPRDDEPHVVIDGTRVTEAYVREAIGI